MSSQLNLVRNVFLAAVELPPERRPDYLDETCGLNADLRAEVEQLLAAHADPNNIVEPTSHSTPRVTDTFVPTAPAEVSASGPEATTHRPTDAPLSDGNSGPGLTEAAPSKQSPADHVPDPLTIQSEGTARVHLFTAPPGLRVIDGRYTLMEVIGEGGMGTVYLASQTEPVKRQVALKLIKAGMDSRAVLTRFDAERQALAMMDHPNIARIYDGGLTPTGQPFFVMELVKGVPLTEYCDTHRLTVDARLKLFVSVCQAVQHAHQKGIIHRDLKPGNILVTEVDGRPTPKVIDFGVAKATELKLTDMSFPDTGAIVGTPAYMSPEQADPSSMDIDTRTDVYALGVMLYEMLVGSPPFDARQFKRGAILEMFRMVREIEPPRPSTKLSAADALPNIAANRNIEPTKLAKLLKGELDWVVMKALEKDRTRRYETANGLARDIQRYLADEVVEARPPSRGYRLKKFVKRNKIQVIAASLVLLALMGGVAGTTWGLFEAKRQEGLANQRERGERLAKQEALDAADKERLATQKALVAADDEKKARETVEDVLGFVEDKVFAAARPKGEGGGLGYDVKLADAIKAALPSIETRFRNKPLTEARLRRTIGTSFRYLGKPEITVAQLETARSLYTRELGPDHSDTLSVMNGLSGAYADLGKTAEALKLREESLALLKAKLGPDHIDTIRSKGNLALSYLALGRIAEAVELAEETLALLKAKLGPDHLETIKCMQILVFGYSGLGRDAEALKLQEEALGLAKNGLGLDDTETIRIIHNLAAQYAKLGRNVEALKLGEEELALRRIKLGPDNPQTLNSMRNVAGFLTAVGRHADSVKLREEALPLQKTNLGPDHPETLKNMVNLANSYFALGRHAEALKLREEVLHREQLRLQKEEAGVNSPEYAGAVAALGLNLLGQEKWTEAEPLLREFLAIREKTQPDVWSTFNTMSQLGRALLGQKKYADAERLLLAGYEGMKRREKTIPPLAKMRIPEAIDRLIKLYSATNKQDEVKKWQAERAKYPPAPLPVAPMPREKK